MKTEYQKEEYNPLPLPFALDWETCPKCNSNMNLFNPSNSCLKCGTPRITKIIVEPFMPLSSALIKDQHTRSQEPFSCVKCGTVFLRMEGSERTLCRDCKPVKKYPAIRQAKAYKNSYVCAKCKSKIHLYESHFVKYASMKSAEKTVRWHEECYAKLNKKEATL